MRRQFRMIQRILATLLLVAAVDAAAAAPSRTDEVPTGTATNWILGHRLLRDGDIQGALPFLHLAYRAQPDEPIIAMDFQYALAAEGYLADAIGVMDDLIAAHPDSSSWRLRRSSLNLRAGNTDEALADLRELRHRGEVTLEVLGTEAAIHLRQGRVGSALDVYRDGLYLLPEDRADIYLGMVDVLQQADETERIPEILEEALAAEPDNPGLWIAAVRAHAILGHHEEALAAATHADREVLPLRPVDPGEDPRDSGHGWDAGLPSGHPRGVMRAADRWPADNFRTDLADVYARTGEVDRAVAVLETLRDSDGLGLTASLWLARMLLGTGRHEDAAVQIELINGSWPESGRGWFLRGKLAESRNDWAGAIKDHRRAVESSPGNAELQVALVRAMLVTWEKPLANTEDPESEALREELHRTAMAASTRVADADATSQLVLGYAFRASGDPERGAWRFGVAAEDPGLRLTALIQQSICYDEADQSARARRVLERMRHEYPGDAEVANSFGYFLAEKNEDLGWAETLVREALEAEPNNGAFLDSMGWVYYRLGRYDDAFDYLVRAVNVLPEDPVILEHLGLILRALGREDEARSTLERALANGGDRERLESLMDPDQSPEPEEP